MEFTLKNLLNKLFNKQSPNQTINEAEVKKALDQKAKRLDSNAKLNMLDAKLSKENALDFAQIRGNLKTRDPEVFNELQGKNQNDFFDETLLQVAIAEEQEKFNYQFLTNSNDKSTADKLDLFAQNATFSNAAEIITEANGNTMDKCTMVTPLTDDKPMTNRQLEPMIDKISAFTAESKKLKEKGLGYRFNDEYAKVNVEKLANLIGGSKSEAIVFASTMDKYYTDIFAQFNNNKEPIPNIELLNTLAKFVYKAANSNFDEYSKTQSSQQGK